MTRGALTAFDCGDKQIFNHDIMDCTHEQVVGNYLYSGRALGLTHAGDIIQIHPILKSEWDAIVAHYDRIELTHTRHVVWDVSLERLAEFPDHSTSVFFFGDHVNAVRPDPYWLTVVEQINSKNRFMALANELGMDVPQTFCFGDKSEIASCSDFPFPCYLKPAVSVSGVGIYRCEDVAQCERALATFQNDVPLQVQEEIESNTFLNLQFRVTSSGVEHLAVTEQILDGYAHAGNRYPATHEPWEVVEPMAAWMQQHGMKCIFAFDVAVVENGEGVHFPAIECNPRFNGASYPTAVAKKLALESWMACQFETSRRSLAAIDLDGIEYDPDTKTGVILVNWGTILVGKLGVLLAGPPQIQEALKNKLRERLA